MANIKERVLTYIRQNPGKGPTEITEALEANRNTVGLCLVELKKEGLVDNTKEYGKYHPVSQESPVRKSNISLDIDDIPRFKALIAKYGKQGIIEIINKL